MNKKILMLIFLTLFLDLVSFSIIFPLFPSMARYYWHLDQDSFLLGHIYDLLTFYSDGHKDPTVLFGSFLSVIFSLLQFLFTPYWGRLSDRIGRRPVLLITIAGLTISHLLWIFAANFAILLVGRMLGGIMSGNLSTATAAVADITNKENRGRGMAVVGMAFALGFIIGPSLGGILSTVNIAGLNPYAAPALFSFLLSVLNFVLVKKYFIETNLNKNAKDAKTERSSNILKLFSPLPYPGVNLSNWGHFLFIFALSGAEFALLFLVVDRFHFSPMNNGLMFLYVGLVLALIQGGFVRRKAHTIGYRRLTLIGFFAFAMSLVLITFSQSTSLLFVALFFFALGSSFILPGLTSLVSCYSPAAKQGETMGVFRSLGSLGRVLGPPVMAFIYWHQGKNIPFVLSALILIIPIMMVIKLPPVDFKEEII